MNYYIKKKLCPMDFGYLKSIIGEELEEVSVPPLYDEPFSEGFRCFAVELITSWNKVVVNNTVIDEKDHDEYFQLSVNDRFTRTTNSRWQILNMDFSGAIMGITIYRDHVSWSDEEDSWEVEADVAILLHFKDSQILLKAIDSLAGFIAIYNDEEAIRHEIEDAESTWLRFKTDKVDQCYRECLNLK